MRPELRQQLEALSSHELSAVINLCKALGGRESALEVGESRPERDFVKAIERYHGEHFAAACARTKREFGPAWKGVEVLVEAMQPKDAMERRVAINIVVWCVTERIASWSGVPLTPGVLLRTCRNQCLDAVDTQFPGYAATGLLPHILKNCQQSAWSS